MQQQILLSFIRSHFFLYGHKRSCSINSHILHPPPFLPLSLVFLLFPSVHHRQEVGALAERRRDDGISVHYLTVYREQDESVRSRTEAIEISRICRTTTAGLRHVCVVCVAGLRAFVSVRHCSASPVLPTEEVKLWDSVKQLNTLVFNQTREKEVPLGDDLIRQ